MPVVDSEGYSKRFDSPAEAREYRRKKKEVLDAAAVRQAEFAAAAKKRWAERDAAKAAGATAAA